MHTYMQIVHELLETSEPAAESVETPMEIPIEPTQDPSSKFQSTSVQTCLSKRNVRTQVVPKEDARVSCHCHSMNTCITFVFLIQKCKFTSTQHFKMLECSVISFSSRDTLHEPRMQVYSVTSSVHCLHQLQE